MSESGETNRENGGTAGKLLHDLDFAEVSRSGNQTYRLIFAKRTGFRYLILTASPVWTSIPLNTSLYLPLPTFRMI